MRRPHASSFLLLSLLLASSGCDDQPQPAEQGDPVAEADPASKGEPKPEADAEQPATPAALELTSITVRRSTPSLGSGGSESSATVHPGHFDSPEAWKAEITKLLDETRVHDTATLREFAAAYLAKDTAKLQAITNKEPKKALETGGYFTKLTLTTSAGEQIEIRHVEALSLSGHWHRFFGAHLRPQLRATPTSPSGEERLPPGI